MFLPPMVFLLVAMAGLIFYKKKRGFHLVLFSLSLFLLLSLPVVENRIAVWWESFPPLQAGYMQRFQPKVIVVIGGGLEHSGQEYDRDVTMKTGTLLRVRYAAHLSRESGLPVLASGGASLKGFDVSESELMAAALRDEFSVPVVWQEQESLNTAENARLSRQILQRLSIDRIILVTEAYHMRRAENEFRKAGFEVMAAPTAFIGHADSDLFSLAAWLPSVKALEHGFLLSYETIGMLWYSLRY